MAKLSKKDAHVGRFFWTARSRARRKNIPFNITMEYLRKIATDECPIFKHTFIWGFSELGKGKTTGDSPSLDRIIPELGYIEGNVVFISHNANRIKNDATEKELYLVADWLHDKRKEVLNAQKTSTTPVPAGHDREGEGAAITGAVHGAGPGQDSDSINNYSGAI
jgi:hypothetical protein